MTKNKSNIIFRLFSAILIIAFSLSSANALLYQYSNANDSQSIMNSGGDIVQPQFSVQLLKYEPYPVNPGDWFDVWIQAKNVGQNDAPDARVEFIPSYPFTINDSTTRDFGTVSGTVNAAANKQAGEQDSQVNQIIVKYRLKVADNAPEGTNIVKFNILADKKDPRSKYSFSLPIIVGKTRTDFEIAMQDSSTQGVSFSIVNIGQNPATAIIMSVKDQDGIKITGAKSSVIGNLDKGDFTTQTFQITTTKDVPTATIDVSYTDIGGVRNTIEKIVPINVAKSTFTGTGAASRTPASSFLGIQTRSWIFIIIGIFIGFAAEFLIQRKRK